MTKKEVVKIINTVLCFGKCDCPKEEIEECLKMIVEVFEQESCDDCVSRQAVLKEFEEWINDGEDWMEHPVRFARSLISLPPVTPHYTNDEIQKMQEMEQAEIKKAYELGKAEQSKTGHWVKYSFPRCGEQHYKCTACDDYINFGEYSDYYLKAFKYCPFCGARMQEEVKI